MVLTSALLSGSLATLAEPIYANQQPSIYINNVEQHYAQPALVTAGNTLVPMRPIFESLQASLKWNGTEQQITATKGNIVIKLTIGSNTATVDKKVIRLSVPATNSNGNTMVPLRFISEALGAEVKWDAASNKIFINANNSGGSTNGTTNINGKGITLQFGGHDYGSINQAEYNQVISRAKAAWNAYKNPTINPYLIEYINGVRWDNNKGNATPRNIALKQAQDQYGSLVQFGISQDTIFKLIAATIASGSLTREFDESVPDGGLTSSADLLLRGLRDCNSLAYTQSAVFDAAGFNTAILARPGHAYTVVEASAGNWFVLNAGGFQKVDFYGSSAPSGEFVKSAPTYKN